MGDMKENLETQLNELEMLVAMYPGDKELQLGDPALLQDIQEYLDGNLEEPPSVELTLNLDIDGCAVIETIVKMPSDYPLTSLPEVYLRSEKLSRSEQSRINEDVQKALSTSAIPQEPCILYLVDWVQSEGSQYITSASSNNITDIPDSSSKVSSSGMFSRYWIYSHHIYSKIKRKNMLDMSKEYNLTGFVLPGKPGIICIEGDSKNVGDWWAIVRNWQWKRLSLKIQQDEATDEIDRERKFSGFQEIGELKEGCNRGNHMDMGVFQSYLEEHGFKDIFAELFSISK